MIAIIILVIERTLHNNKNNERIKIYSLTDSRHNKLNARSKYVINNFLNKECTKEKK